MGDFFCVGDAGTLAGEGGCLVATESGEVFVGCLDRGAGTFFAGAEVVGVVVFAAVVDGVVESLGAAPGRRGAAEVVEVAFVGLLPLTLELKVDVRLDAAEPAAGASPALESTSESAFEDFGLVVVDGADGRVGGLLIVEPGVLDPIVEDLVVLPVDAVDDSVGLLATVRLEAGLAVFFRRASSDAALARSLAVAMSHVMMMSSVRRLFWTFAGR